MLLPKKSRRTCKWCSLRDTGGVASASKKSGPGAAMVLLLAAWPTILSLPHPSVPHKSTPSKPHDDEDADIRKKLDRVRNQKWQHRRCGQIWTSEVGCATSCHGCRGHHALRVSGCALLRARPAHSGPGPTGGHAYRQRRAGGLVGSATAQLTSHDIHAT